MRRLLLQAAPMREGESDPRRAAWGGSLIRANTRRRLSVRMLSVRAPAAAGVSARDSGGADSRLCLLSFFCFLSLLSLSFLILSFFPFLSTALVPSSFLLRSTITQIVFTDRTSLAVGREKWGFWTPIGYG